MVLIAIVENILLSIAIGIKGFEEPRVIKWGAAMTGRAAGHHGII